MAAADQGFVEAEIVIVGAGIAGLATAIALKRVGTGRVLVLERAPALRVTGAALALFPNAWRALAALGVAHKLTHLYPAFQKGRVTNITTGATLEVSLVDIAKVASSDDVVGVRPVHRKVLLESLSEELPPGTIRFNAKVSSISTQTPSGVVLRLDDGTVIRAKVLIGCDGVRSVVAQWLGLSVPIDSHRAAVRAISVCPDGHGLDLAFHQLVSKNERVGIAPLNDKEVFWFMTHRSTSTEIEIAKEPGLITQHVMESIAKDFPPCFLELARRSEPSTTSWAPLLLRLPWNVAFGPTHEGNVAVTGDAMHPMTPDVAQGGGTALEDAVVLGRNLAACLRLDGSVDGERAGGCLAKFAKERRWRVAWVTAVAYLSGWVQQGGTRWWNAAVRFVRDTVFYRFIFPKMLSNIVNYDCGSLPAAVRPNPN